MKIAVPSPRGTNAAGLYFERLPFNTRIAQDSALEPARSLTRSEHAARLVRRLASQLSDADWAELAPQVMAMIGAGSSEGEAEADKFDSPTARQIDESDPKKAAAMDERLAMDRRRLKGFEERHPDAARIGTGPSFSPGRNTPSGGGTASRGFAERFPDASRIKLS